MQLLGSGSSESLDLNAYTSELAHNLSTLEHVFVTFEGASFPRGQYNAVAWAIQRAGDGSVSATGKLKDYEQEIILRSSPFQRKLGKLGSRF